MRTTSRVRGLMLLALAAVGCGGKYSPVAVEGTVTLDGQPLDGAMVSFLPQEGAGRAATGMTDADGTFQLTTFQEGDGALPGTYRVIVTRTDAIPEPPEPLRPGNAQKVREHYREVMAHRDKKSSLPAVYGDETKTPFIFSVPTREKVVLALQSRPGT